MIYATEHVESLHVFVKQAKSHSEMERGFALLALAKGKKRVDVAEIFEISLDTLDRWQTAFKRSGITGISDRPYPGNHFTLSKEQKAAIKELVETKTPKELGLSEKRFWSVRLLKQLIKREYGVIYQSEATYRKMFYSFGFSCHKPGRHNRNQRPTDVERFRIAVKKRSDNTRGWAVWYW